VLERFVHCRWPGNLRQLANVLRTASIMAEGTQQIELDDLPDDFLLDCAALADGEGGDDPHASRDARGARGAPGHSGAFSEPGRDASGFVRWPSHTSSCGSSCGSSGMSRETVAAPPGLEKPARMEDWQTTLIEDTLARLGGNVSAAARELGLARNTVYRYLRRANGR
jgi:transcriptional regulator of acetoin/glycerol metabolism